MKIFEQNGRRWLGTRIALHGRGAVPGCPGVGGVTGLQLFGQRAARTLRRFRIMISERSYTLARTAAAIDSRRATRSGRSAEGHCWCLPVGAAGCDCVQ